MEKIIRSIKGYKKGDRILTSDSFGRTYIGVADGFTSQKIEGKVMKFIKVKDSAGNVIGRNVKNCRNLSR